MSTPEYIDDTPLACTVSVSRKVNLGGYESADVFFSVSGVTRDTSAKEIAELLEGAGALAYESVRTKVEAEAKTLKGAPSGAIDGPRTPKPLTLDPKPKPKVIRLSGGELGALKRIEDNLYRQLSEHGVVPALVNTDTPEGSLARDAIRVQVMGNRPFDPKLAVDYRIYLQALTKYRDEKIPQKGLEG